MREVSDDSSMIRDSLSFLFGGRRRKNWMGGGKEGIGEGRSSFFSSTENWFAVFPINKRHASHVHLIVCLFFLMNHQRIWAFELLLLYVCTFGCPLLFFHCCFVHRDDSQVEHLTSYELSHLAHHPIGLYTFFGYVFATCMNFFLLYICLIQSVLAFYILCCGHHVRDWNEVSSCNYLFFCPSFWPPRIVVIYMNATNNHSSLRRHIHDLIPHPTLFLPKKKKDSPKIPLKSR